jgi:hypothetical protein
LLNNSANAESEFGAVTEAYDETENEIRSHLKEFSNKYLNYSGNMSTRLSEFEMDDVRYSDERAGFIYAYVIAIRKLFLRTVVVVMLDSVGPCNAEFLTQKKFKKP